MVFIPLITKSLCKRAPSEIYYTNLWSSFCFLLFCLLVVVRSAYCSQLNDVSFIMKVTIIWITQKIVFIRIIIDRTRFKRKHKDGIKYCQGQVQAHHYLKWALNLFSYFQLKFIKFSGEIITQPQKYSSLRQYNKFDTKNLYRIHGNKINKLIFHHEYFIRCFLWGNSIRWYKFIFPYAAIHRVHH